MTLNAFAVSNGAAQSLYLIKKGDVFSQIVRKELPGPLYGPRGRLVEVLGYNPQIKNPHRIYPSQTITLRPSAPVELLSTTEKIIPLDVESQQDQREISSSSGPEGWSVSALYGAKFVSVSQSGALGTADVGVLFLNNFKLKSEFTLDDWSAWLQLDSYKFKYKSLSAGDEQSMYAADIGASYKWILGSIGAEQSPLFKSSAGSLEMTKMALMYLSVGAKKNIELPTRKPTVVRLKGWLRYPIASATDNAQVEVDSVSGFGLRGQVELNRLIFSKENYSLHGSWMTDVGYQKVSQVVKWGASSGKVESNLVSASTALGVLFGF
jgi:hypothetical protein